MTMLKNDDLTNNDQTQVHDNIGDDEIRIVGTNLQFSTQTMDAVLKENEESEQAIADTPLAVSEAEAVTGAENRSLMRKVAPGAPAGFPPVPKRKRHVLPWLVLLLLLLVFAIIGIKSCLTPLCAPPYDEILAGDTLTSSSSVQVDTMFVAMSEEERGDSAVSVPEAPVACMLVTDTMINDIPLKLYTPQGGRVELSMGRPSESDTTLLFACQAADVRADINAPAGAFIYHGELKSKGYSKLGFCAIIQNEITIGRAKETTEFERAIEQDGDFFRHYSLVCKGTLIEVPVKGKAKRRALCILQGAVTIVECVDRESYHDFSQALVDMGCEEAVALVGGDALMYWWDEEQGSVVSTGSSTRSPRSSENYIVWRRL